MRAVWYDRTGAADVVLAHGTLPDPLPGPGEVRVRLQASGINPSDVKTRSGARGAMAFARQIPHSDGAGVIDAVGEGVAEQRLGERVYVWNGAFGRAHGTCAEAIAVPAAQAVPLPAAIGFATGACLGIPAMTAAHAVFADGRIEGQTVLVTGGAGAVGECAIQLARWGGARVIATVSTDRKAQAARHAGAHDVIDYRTTDVAEAVAALTDGQGVDRVVEVEFGGNLAASARMIRPGGVIAAYGSMADPAPVLPFYPLMFAHVTLRLMLVYRLSPRERERVIAMIDAALVDGSLAPTVALRVPLAETARAHLAVEAGTLIGNAVVEIAG